MDFVKFLNDVVLIISGLLKSALNVAEWFKDALNSFPTLDHSPTDQKGNEDK